jgi:hypothetical protein
LPERAFWGGWGARTAVADLRTLCQELAGELSATEAVQQ